MIDSENPTKYISDSDAIMDVEDAYNKIASLYLGEDESGHPWSSGYAFDSFERSSTFNPSRSISPYLTYCRKRHAHKERK